MSALFSVTLLATALGLFSFGVGMLPLTFAIAKNHLSLISRLGTGLLIGTAFGVIIPEGVEALIASSPSPNSAIPTTTLALSLLFGFCIMLAVEHLGPAAHGHGNELPQSAWTSTPGVDVELSQLENEQGIPHLAGTDAPIPALPLTLGMVLHGFADGLALGVSALSVEDAHSSTNLSLVVFMALAVHKAPTALAFTISLLSTSLPRNECRKHLLVFSSSTPIGAIAAYLLFYLTGFGDASRVGIALLVSGGSFLYVATVLQPVTHGQGETEGAAGRREAKMQLALLLAGAFIPLLMSTLLGHEH
ncbi:Zinc/iron permease [Peniophora sp. CONT]|nr:Zinc/iron permease [Peniophora sp. CONT]